jgi:tetratricopeptide (TPR) repeat protein
MADVSLFGVTPRGPHAVNVLLHAVNALLLLALLARLTGVFWRSALVAALFALHPLHVESVAWVSERKDVLSTLFWLLATAAYLRYVRRPGLLRYLPVAALLALGLMAKPMLVTLPFTLLLLDWWPLGRLGTEAEQRGFAPASPSRLVLEKVPMLLLAAASSVVTYLAQAGGGAVVQGLVVAPWQRVANALVSYAGYLAKTIWPARLAALYPHPAIAGGVVPAWQVAGSALLLAAVSLLAFRLRRSRPYLLWGWCWYLGTLVPVIGLVQVGAQAMADRYTYVPLIGILVAAVWWVDDLLEERRAVPWVAAVLGGAAVLACALASSRQVAHWRDSISLHRHAVEVTDRNWLALRALGDAYTGAGRYPEAIAAHRQAIEILPGLAEAWHGLGVAYGQLGRHREAIGHFAEALRLNPAYATAWNNLGSAHRNLGEYPEAVQCYRRALALRPDDARAWANLGTVSLLLGDAAQAAESLRRLQALDPARAARLQRQMEEAGNAR